jgi:hypothetical protein
MQRHVKEENFVTEVCAWIAQQGEVFLDIYYPRTAGVHDYVFVHSCAYLLDLLNTLPPQCNITVFRDKQLPLRGIVTQEFEEQALIEIPDKSGWFAVAAESEVIEADGRIAFHWLPAEEKSRRHQYHAEADSSHETLCIMLRENWGKYIAVGLDFPTHIEDAEDARVWGMEDLIDEG